MRRYNVKLQHHCWYTIMLVSMHEHMCNSLEVPPQLITLVQINEVPSNV